MRANQDPSDRGTDNGAGGKPFVQPAAISLPKGGGAIQGISEKFATNPVTGTSSFSIPIPSSPARGFEPQLGLSYDSGSGNGPFGLGWTLGVPSIARKTEQGLPQYRDHDDSDTFVLSGADDLVPLLKESGGDWEEAIAEKELGGVRWEVKLYRPRIEGAFIKIERWRNPQTAIIWWRTTSGQNITSVYGYSESARVADPVSRERIFKWLIDCSYDDKGHYTQYVYKQEDRAGIDYGLASERHRREVSVIQTYLKRVLYGIKRPYWTLHEETEEVLDKPFGEHDFHFQTVLDYGEHTEPSAEESADWQVRHDSFSTYRAGFEIRTYRRCERVLLFHQFENELAIEREPVAALVFEYDDQTAGLSFLTRLTHIGYKRGKDGALGSKPLPSMTFRYQEHAWNSEIKTVDAGSAHSLPNGVDGQQYQWVDLYSEGLSGILTEQAGGLYYKQNLGSATFAEAKPVSPAPSLKGLVIGALQIQDLESSGIKSLVSPGGPLKGFYRIDDQAAWQHFRPFGEMPNIDFQDPNLRNIDLDGDGRPDLLVSEERAFRWYPSAGEDGYGAARMAAKAQDENAGPAVVFANEAESIFFADMSGDGLQDIVRIRNGSVVYWPNLGYGRFGAKVTMGQAPTFNHPDLFAPGHIRLADLDGSGTTDIVYLGKNEFRYWLNLNGNSWSTPHSTINPFPWIDNLSAVSVIDLLGSGTGCVVWSSPLPKYVGQQIRYIDLMESRKPHLMTNYQNGMGKEVNLSYTPSTRFYLEDKQKGEPWVTKLHFPVHCLSKVETFDHITKARFASSYSYHHGYYDHAEREFRGFGRVDQTDTEEYEHFVKHGSSNVVEHALHQSPVLTKTWFHTGVYLDQDRILSQCEHEYFKASALDDLALAKPELPESLTAGEWREALRACKGMALRAEVYGLDGTEHEGRPYSIAQATCQIKRIQPKGNNRHASLQLISSESVSLQLDRNPEDPRISHSLVLETDDYGNPTLSAAVGYPRRLIDETLPSDVRTEQGETHVVVSQAEFTNNEYGIFGSFNLDGPNDAVYRLPVVWKSSTFDLGGVADRVATLFTRTELSQAFQDARPVGYEDLEAPGLVKRQLKQSETRFINDSLDGALIPGALSPLGIAWQTYQLAFTPSLLQSIYGDKVDSASLEAGYVDLNGGGHWWVPSGTAIYSEDAAEKFFIPEGARDPFGNPSWVDLDDYLLLSIRSRDAKQNEVIAFNDYRTLQPQFVRDPNHNWSGVEVDELGMVIKSAVMGKVSQSSDGEPPEPDATTGGDNLVHPSAELSYGFYDPVNNQPAYAHTKRYVNHHAADASDQREDYLQQYEYSDGSGNVVMVKAQATPGMAKQRNADGAIEEVDTSDAVRWIGNGRTILNNKGNPVKQYEPYFSITHEYEDDPALVEVGITPILFYDAAGRNDCKLNPNHSYEKIVFNPWQQTSWDVNDTLLLENEDGLIDDNPANDPHVGHYFVELDPEEYRLSWYGARVDGDLGAEQERAAEKAVPHANTPVEVYTDALGRTIYALADNGEYDRYKARTVLDIEGNTLAVIDDRGNTVMAYAYDMLPSPDEKKPKPARYQNGMDGGEKWTLFNVLGRPIRGWDSRDHVFENQYDELNRPTESRVRETGVDKLVGLVRYHDSSSPDADAIRSKNLIGAAYEVYDQAGLVETLQQDFKGNITHARRTLAIAYKETVDWGLDVPPSLLQAEYFESASEYDALNRVTYSLSPHNQAIPASETWLAYNESGWLDWVDVAIRGGERKPYVTDIDYDAKGQRQKIEYGNRVVTEYEYEPDTYRLKRVHTTRGSGDALQDLNYTYDPVGNVTEIRDNAQQTHFFRNQVVEPHNEYSYDPLYRLIGATGREHAGQNPSPSYSNGWLPEVHPNDGNAMRRYTQSYLYDGVGNILRIAHSDGDNGWTRNYQYAEDSNRLLATTLGDPGLPFEEPYEYNSHGSVTSMPHLRQMDWDFAEQLWHVDLNGGGHGYYIYDGGGQRTRKIVETNGTTVKERIYLGGWEIYRESVAGGLKLERETLHIMDDRKRIALIDTKTVSDGRALVDTENITRYQLGNHLNSASLELNENGDVISYEELHPYGTTAYFAGTSVVEDSTKRYRYTGKERDEETGFSYHGARYYVGGLGRWCSADPNGISDGLNVYRYVRNNPMIGVDPNGGSTLPFLLFLQSDNAQVDLNELNSPPAFTGEYISAFWNSGGNNVVMGAIIFTGGVLIVIGTGGTAAPVFVLVSGLMAVGAGTVGMTGGVIELGLRESGVMGDSSGAWINEQQGATFNRITNVTMNTFSSPGSLAGGTVGAVGGFLYAGDLGGVGSGIETGAAVGGLAEFGVGGVMALRNLAIDSTALGKVWQVSGDPKIALANPVALAGTDVLSTHGNVGSVTLYGGSVGPINVPGLPVPIGRAAGYAMSTNAEKLLFSTCLTACDAAAMQKFANVTNKTAGGFEHSISVEEGASFLSAIKNVLVEADVMDESGNILRTIKIFVPEMVGGDFVRVAPVWFKPDEAAAAYYEALRASGYVLRKSEGYRDVVTPQ